MIPVRLTISGFLSYRETAEVDFTGIHVACISGRNGAGKSAMLDAMTWALFGEARKNDDSVINDNAPDNTAKVSFEFRYENAEYLVRRQRTAGKTQTLEFFIRAADGENWKPLTEKKLTDTNKRICSILHMDYRTFINASFFLQGKADQFTGQSPAERKKILGSILDLEVWETYKAKAAEKRKLAETGSQYIKGLIDEAEEELGREQILLSEYRTAKERAEAADKDYQEANEKWQIAKAGEASLKLLKESAEQKKRDEELKARQIRDQERILDERIRERDALQAGIANGEAIEKDYQELLRVREQLDRFTAAAAEYARLGNERVRLESAIRSAENQLRYEVSQLSRKKEELDRLLPEKQRLEAQREAASPRIEAMIRNCAALPETRRLEQEAVSEGRALRAVMDNFDAKINDVQKKIENLLANRGGICPTCGREMDEAHCRTHAKELQAQIEQFRAEKDQKSEERLRKLDEYRALKARVLSMEEQEKELNTAKIELGKCEQKLRMIDEQLAQGEEIGAGLAKAENALKNEDFCTEERERLAGIQQQIAELAYDRDEHERVSREKARLSGAEKKHQELIAGRSRIEPLNREIREKEESLTQAREHLEKLRPEREEAEKTYLEAKEKMPDMKLIEAERTRLNLERDHAGKELGHAEQRVRHLDEARKVLESRSAEYREIQEKIRRYKDLEKAFGKDGIPALLIEQAVPEIEEQANRILTNLSGDTMSLQLITQGAYKSKKDSVKETLDILIKDLYGVRAYEMYSGGEAFRINFSLRLALSRILARRAGSRLQTLVIDEGFGSQDDEGRARLAEAILAVQNDFEKILVITHLSELKEAFPSRIEVEKTEDGSRIEVIP